MRRFFRPVFIMWLLIVCIGAESFATEEETLVEQHLDEISITATRMERKTAEVSASVSVVEEEEIKNTKMFNIQEVLSGTPGVLIESPNQGYDSRVIIRGAGLKARYGVRDIMVLLDGVPITDPDSMTRLDFIDTQLIKQVEVVKGPNSTLWGANAAGGVINIITKSPFEREGGVIKLGVGDYDTQSYHLSYSNDVKEKLYYTVSGSRRQSDNSWRRWNEFDTNQGSVQASALFADGSTLDNYFGYTEAYLQLPGKLNEQQFEDYLETGRAPETNGPWQYSSRDSNIFFFNSRLTKQFGRFEFKPMIFFNQWEHLHPVTGRINEAETYTYGTDLQLNHAHTLAGKEGVLTMGITGRIDDQDTDYYKYSDFLATPSGRILEVLSDERGALIETQNRQVYLYGIYAQESFRPSDSWIIDVGLRYDEIRFDITGTRTEEYSYAMGRYVPADDPEDIDKRFSNVSPRLGINYKLTEIFNLYTSAAKGIQTPTESEISDNPDLELVEVQNYEVGIKARHRRWDFDAAVYYSPVDNEVVQVIQPDSESMYINAGRTEKKGFEFEGTYYIMPDLGLGAGYSYTDYTFDNFTEPVRSGMTTVNMDRSGNELPFIPRHQYSLYLAYQHPAGFKFKVQSNFWGSYYIDNANTEKYEGYDFITNVMIGYDKGAFGLSVNVYNLFDKQYALEVQKDTQGEKLYNPAPPINFIVRGTYRF
jgi:iron complex outermembrane recepter protein